MTKLFEGAFWFGMTLNVVGCVINLVAIALDLSHGQYDRAGWQTLAASIAGFGVFALVSARIRITHMREAHAASMTMLTAQSAMAKRMNEMVAASDATVTMEIETDGRKH